MRSDVIAADGPGPGPALAGRAFHPLVERIRRDIFQRRLRPGDRLPHERAMAEAFGVGRSAVREALRVLEMQGLVRVRHGYQGGVFVAEPGAERFVEALGTWLRHDAVRVDELYQARLLVEPALARVAAERDGPTLARVLAANVEQAEACRAAGGSPFRLNVEFHAILAMAGGNRVVNGIMRTVLDLLVERRAEAEPAAASLSDRAVGDHHDLLRAIGAGDGRLVEALMLSHLARVHAPPAASLEAPAEQPPALLAPVAAPTLDVDGRAPACRPG